MFYIYVLASIPRRYLYVGLTGDITRRIKEHQDGRSKTTAPYRPFRLVLTEEYETRPEARRREKYLKSGIGKEYIKQVDCAGGEIGRRTTLRW